jgi:curved DNA-binding protein CbpA
MAADHYDVLGVPPDADPVVIKRRYRLLVRQHHPDAVQISERERAHERMLLINAAWTVLSDPAERARYDRARQPRVVPKPTGNGTSNSTPNGRTRVDGWVGGTSPGASASGASTRSAANAGSRYNATKGRRSNPRTRTLTMVFEAAELYFFHGRAAEAIAMCNQVLQLDPRNAEAAALLGDIFAEQGRREGAIAMYERAVRSQPDNALYRQKWEALRSGAPGTPAYAPYAAVNAHRAGTGTVTGNVQGSPGQAGAGARVGTGRSGAGGTHGTNGVTGASASPASATSRHAGGAPSNGTAASRSAIPTALSRRAVSLGYSLLFGAAVLVTWLLFTPPPELPAFYANRTVEEPTALMLILASMAGVLSGAALPLIGLIDSVQHMRTRETVTASLMLIVGLALLGAVAFPLSIALFCLFSLIRRSVNKSLLIILMASLFLASTLALPFPDDNLPVLQQALLFWSGRTIFPAMLSGWFIGSLGHVKL